MKKEPSAAQIAARKKLGEAAKARAAAKRAAKEGISNTVSDPKPPVQEPTTAPEIEDFEVTDFKETPSNDELQRQLQETQKTLELLLKGSQLNQPQPQQGMSVGNQGQLLGVVEKYLIDPANYPSPTERLAEEPRLSPLAFKFNYLLEYSVSISTYQTQSGVHMKEPKFHITLYRKVIDSQGRQVQAINPQNGKLEDKYYIARKLIFHEDPEAAMVIARDNGIEIDRSNERLFLNEMRYLRARDWLFDIFWPTPATTAGGIIEESIGGSIFQVVTKSSEESSEIDFSSLDKKMKV